MLSQNNYGPKPEPCGTPVVPMIRVDISKIDSLYRKQRVK